MVPRVLALLITLPLLGVIANIAGLLGGAVMAWLELGVSPAMFVVRLSRPGRRLALSRRHHQGAVLRAWSSALIGCHHGLKVGGNAESLGRLTSASVVLAIFLVIVLDAIFAIFFATVNV